MLEHNDIAREEGSDHVIEHHACLQHSNPHSSSIISCRGQPIHGDRFHSSNWTDHQIHCINSLSYTGYSSDQDCEREKSNPDAKFDAPSQTQHDETRSW